MKVKGWAQVMKFTYIQTVKSKPFIIGCVVILVVLLLMMLGINYLPNLIMNEVKKDRTVTVTDENGNEIEETAAFDIDKVYILDKSGLNPDFTFLKEAFVEYEIIGQESYDEIEAKVADSEEKAEVLTVIEKTEDDAYSITMSRPKIGTSDEDCRPLLSALSSAVTEANLTAHGIDLETLKEASAPIATRITVNGEETRGELADIFASTSNMIVSLIMFLAIYVYAAQTGQAVATEKSSRVMELLLTSIKPLAVIVGKVLAMALVSLTSVVGIGAATAIMFAALAPTGSLGEIVGEVQPNSEEIEMVSNELGKAFGHINAVDIVLIVIVFIMGFLFFSLISGLFGATVSKIEDLQTAMQPFALIGVLGFYLSYFPSIAGMSGGEDAKAIIKVSYYVPISSPFALPGAILSGDITPLETVIALAVLAVCLVLFAMFVAKVYEHIILYSGSKLKIKDMIKMAKKNKA